MDDFLSMQIQHSITELSFAWMNIAQSWESRKRNISRLKSGYKLQPFQQNALAYLGITVRPRWGARAHGIDLGKYNGSTQIHVSRPETRNHVIGMFELQQMLVRFHCQANSKWVQVYLESVEGVVPDAPGHEKEMEKIRRRPVTDQIEIENG